MQWYVLFVRGGKEGSIISFLQGEGWNAFTPQMEMMYRKQGQPYIVKKMMFPNYIFIESELDYIQVQQQLNEWSKQKEEIIKELKFDMEGTAALREEEKNFIESLTNEDKVMEHSIGYIEGDKTIVSKGPLKGFESNIVKIDRHKRRALLEVKMMGQIVKISVSLELLTKI